MCNWKLGKRARWNLLKVLYHDLLSANSVQIAVRVVFRGSYQNLKVSWTPDFLFIYYFSSFHNGDDPN